METNARAASNEKDKRELGWTLRYPSWMAGDTRKAAVARGPAAGG